MIQECEMLAGCNVPEEYPAHYSSYRLTGDASTRSYFRITAPSGGTLVLMKMPEPFDLKAFPYLDNYHLFRERDVPLAEIYHMVPERGLVFLQDLGDFTFYELYSSWNDQTRLHHYLKSLHYLRCIESIQPQSDLAFTTERLLWELEYFRKYFLVAFRNISFSEQESADLQQQFLRLASELAGQPRVFCHRDYHSRNLMLQEDIDYVIDFQDARLGPATYDLASLCYDSYIQHSQEFIGHLERFFFVYHPDPQTQRYEYPRMCLQRNLKALGTFGYQVTQMDHPFYLQFIEPTLGYIRKHFERLPEYVEMRDLLARHLPQLQ